MYEKKELWRGTIQMKMEMKYDTDDSMENMHLSYLDGKGKKKILLISESGIPILGITHIPQKNG